MSSRIDIGQASNMPGLRVRDSLPRQSDLRIHVYETLQNGLEKVYEDGNLVVLNFVDPFAPPISPSDNIRRDFGDGGIFISVIRTVGGSTAVICTVLQEVSASGRLNGVRSVIVEVGPMYLMSLRAGLILGRECARHASTKHSKLLDRLQETLDGLIGEPPHAAIGWVVDQLRPLVTQSDGRWYLRFPSPAVSLEEIAYAIDDLEPFGEGQVSLISPGPADILPLVARLGPVVVTDVPLDYTGGGSSEDCTIGRLLPKKGWSIERTKFGAIDTTFDELGTSKVDADVTEVVDQLEGVRAKAQERSLDPNPFLVGDELTRILEALQRLGASASSDVVATRLREYALGQDFPVWRKPSMWLADEAWVARCMLSGAIVRKVASTSADLRWGLVGICILGRWGAGVTSLVRSGELCERLVDSVADREQFRSLQIKYGAWRMTDQRGLAVGIKYCDPMFVHIARFIESAMKDVTPDEIRLLEEQAMRLNVPGLEFAVTLGLVAAVGEEKVSEAMSR
jgi:hypothetical protein